MFLYCFGPLADPVPLKVQEFVDFFMEKPELRASMKHLLDGASKDGGIRVGSICTGWGVAEMVVDALNASTPRDDPYSKASWCGFLGMAFNTASLGRRRVHLVSINMV